MTTQVHIKVNINMGVCTTWFCLICTVAYWGISVIKSEMWLKLTKSMGIMQYYRWISASVLENVIFGANVPQL